MQSIEIPEDDLFWFDKGLVRGAAQFTTYKERLQSWFEGLIP